MVLLVTLYQSFLPVFQSFLLASICLAIVSPPFYPFHVLVAYDSEEHVQDFFSPVFLGSKFFSRGYFVGAYEN